MICQSCNEFGFIKDLERYFVTSNLHKPLDFFADFAVENDDIDCICDNCGASLLLGDLYLEDEDCLGEIKDTLFSELAEEVMKHIESCEECGHGEFMQGLQHSIYSTFNEEGEHPGEMYNKYHHATELNDLIYNVTDFDDSYYEEIAKYISCPHCKNGSGENYDDKIDYGEFSLNDEVYTKEDIKDFEESFYGKSYVKFEEEINRIAHVCSYEELVYLKEEFLRNPLLIAQNTVFQSLYEFLQNLYSDDNCLMLFKSKRVFRARANKDNNLYPEDLMWEAPVGWTSHGRYNVSGLPVLYCSNSKDVLRLEVPDKGYGYTFATLRLLKPFKMFKINPAFGYEFQGFIAEPVPSSDKDFVFKVQYIITNIMASITKQVGFDGIAYVSVHGNRYINYAFFDCERNTDIDIININNM